MNRTSSAVALAWSAIEVFGHQGIQLAVYIVLARLVTPEEFGLVAMLALFFSVGQIIADSGFSNALIQKADDDELDRSTVFYFNLGIGVVLTGVICLSSGWIANFFEEPILQPLSNVMSLMILATSFGLIQHALTRKQLDFRTRAKCSITASLAAAAISIPMAFSGAGVWALAAQMILMRFFQSALLWVMCRWRPKWAFSFARLRLMFGFGSQMLIAGLISAFFNNLYALVIGKIYSPWEVGYYSNAKRYQEYPANNLTRVFSHFSFPAFAREQTDKHRLRILFVKSLRFSSISVFAVMGLLIGIAHPLFETVLGEKWLPSAPLFQVLCIVGLFHPIASINLNLLLARGMSRHFLVLEIIKRVASVVSLLITFRFGIFWIVVGEAVTSAICFFVNTWFTGKYISLSAFQQLRILSRSAALAAVVAAIGYLCTLLPVAAVWKALIGLLAGSVAGILFARCFDRSTFVEVGAAIQSLKRPAVAQGSSG